VPTIDVVNRVMVCGTTRLWLNLAQWMTVSQLQNPPVHTL